MTDTEQSFKKTGNKSVNTFESLSITKKTQNPPKTKRKCTKLNKWLPLYCGTYL